MSSSEERLRVIADVAGTALDACADDDRGLRVVGITPSASLDAGADDDRLRVVLLFAAAALDAGADDDRRVTSGHELCGLHEFASPGVDEARGGLWDDYRHYRRRVGGCKANTLR